MVLSIRVEINLRSSSMPNASKANELRCVRPHHANNIDHGSEADASEDVEMKDALLSPQPEAHGDLSISNLYDYVDETPVSAPDAIMPIAVANNQTPQMDQSLRPPRPSGCRSRTNWQIALMAQNSCWIAGRLLIKNQLPPPKMIPTSRRLKKDPAVCAFMLRKDIEQRSGGKWNTRRRKSGSEEGAQSPQTKSSVAAEATRIRRPAFKAAK